MKSNNKPLSRQSNIELLRLISMLMIIVLHFNGHAFNPAFPSFTEGITATSLLEHATLSLTVTAVTIFVLISGYFSIHFKVRGLLKLYLRCFIWGLFSYVLFCIFKHEPIFGVRLFGRLFAFTHNKWWFINSYLYLFFASPLINAAVNHLTAKDFRTVLILLSIIVIYFGYCRETGDDTWGTSSFHFIYLYLIGRYLGKYISTSNIRNKRWLWLIGWLCCTLITFGLALFAETRAGNVPCCIRAYPYNSPWTIMGAIFAVLFALSFNFQCKTINWLSSSTLSGYLLQDSSYFGVLVLYPAVGVLFSTIPLFHKYFLIIPTSIIFLLTTIIIDKLWNLIIYNPVLSLYQIIETRIIQMLKKRTN